jgi:hypothetical protein
MLRWWQRRIGNAALTVLFLAPFPFLSAVTYGGERLFRVYLFSLPWAALLAAHVLGQLVRPRGGSPLLRVLKGAVATVVCALLLAGWCISAYGQEKANHIHRGEVRAAQWFYDHAPDSSLMQLANGNFPARLEGNYGRYEIRNFFEEPRYENHVFTPADLPRIIRVLEANTRQGLEARRVREGYAYVIVSDSQLAYAELYRQATERDVNSLDTVLAESSSFELVYSNENARVYQLLQVIHR